MPDYLAISALREPHHLRSATQADVAGSFERILGVAVRLGPISPTNFIWKVEAGRYRSPSSFTSATTVSTHTRKRAHSFVRLV